MAKENKLPKKFWSSSIETTKSGESKPKISIPSVDFVNFLVESGFRLYRLDVENFIYVQIESNVVKQVASRDIKHHVIDFVKNSDDKAKYEIENKLLAWPALFSDSFLNALPYLESKFVKDTKEKALFYFKNGFVEVNKEAILFKSYENLEGYIWANQIIAHDYKKIEYKKSIFLKFFQNICKRDKNSEKTDIERFYALKSIAGYLLHDYKEKMKAVCLTDSVISDDPEGRTGKTLFAQALGHLRVFQMIDGKNFRSDDRFKFQNATVDTQILCINDVGTGRERFDIEPLFTSITEGVTVEKKNKTSFLIEPKMILTCNRVILTNGGSAKDRVLEFEFSNHYSKAYSPEKEFGVWFFKDWNKNEWLAFYAFMLECVQEYIKNGILQSQEINLINRTIIENTSRNSNFLEFANGLEHKKEYEKKEVYESFKNLYSPDYEKLKQNTFTSWLKLFAKQKNLTFWEGRSPKPEQINLFSLL